MDRDPNESVASEGGSENMEDYIVRTEEIGKADQNHGENQVGDLLGEGDSRRTRALPPLREP